MINISKNKQGTDEWFADRVGLMTASKAQAIGNNGKGLETLITTLMAEKYSNAPRDNYTNEDMERGNELEGQARALYSLERDVEVQEVGFITNDDYALSGASLDGTVDADGGVEIKCLNDSKHSAQILLENIKVESGYMWQMQMQMMIAEKKWIDYTLYNPHFKENLLVKRVEADDKYFDKLKEGLKAGQEMIKEIEKKIGN